MTDTSTYPSTSEIRNWANSKRPGVIQDKGQLPRYLILAWNKAHPGRPYVAAQAHHGTTNGYAKYGCRCDRCREAYRLAYESKRDERDLELLDAWMEEA